MSEYTNVSWITVDDHGDTAGNGYVTHTALPFTGRIKRSGYTTITTLTSPEESVNVTFNQMPKPEFVTLDESSFELSHSGGTVTLTGTTNSPRLSFEMASSEQGMAAMPRYFSIVVNGQTIGNQDTSGQTFANDPGATAEFGFSISITINGNMGLMQRSCTIKVTGSAGVGAVARITQGPGGSYLNVGDEHESEMTITFSADGYRGAVDVDVYSNDNWTMKITED